MNLQSKVALVTGGGTGLGKETSLMLAKAGMDVAINYSRSKTDAEVTMAKIEELGNKSMIVKADVSSASEVEEMIDSVVKRFGRLDVLVANAGTTVFQPFENLEGVSEDDWDRIMNVNVKGVWLCAKSAARHLKAHGEGRIVVVSSIAGIRPSGSSLPYSVSKSASIHLTKGLAKAMAPDVLVNCIAPGLLETRWTKGHSQSTIDNFLKHSPLHKVPTLDDCARQILALCETDTVTGTTVVVDAGMSL